MAIVKCLRCGAQIDEAAAICPHCGGNVRDKLASNDNCKALATYKTLLDGGIITPGEYMIKERKLRREPQEAIRKITPKSFKPFLEMLDDFTK